MADLPSTDRPDIPEAPIEVQATTPLSLAERAFRYIEHGVMLCIFGVVASVMAIFIYGPIFTACAILALLALHRSRALEGLSVRKQVASYIVVALVSGGFFLWCGRVIEQHRDHIPTLAEIKASVTGMGAANQRPTEQVSKSQTPPTSPSSGDLKTRTLQLSDALMKFSWERDKLRADALKAHPGISPEALARQDEAWNAEAVTRFDNMYGAETRAILKELSASGVDTSSVRISTDGPRKIGLQLSVLAERIGKKPPFGRTLTKAQRDELLNQYSLPVQLYACLTDRDSIGLARQFQAGFRDNGWKGAETIRPLSSCFPRTGIVVTWQYGDNWNAPDFVASLRNMGFDVHNVINTGLELGADGIRVEVWPEHIHP